MREPPIVRPTMNNAERGQFVRKAKADRLAFEAAELLSLGDTLKATSLATAGVTLTDSAQMETWVRHYATTRFKVANLAVDDFLNGIQAV